jgi:hypothetical protein
VEPIVLVITDFAVLAICMSAWLSGRDVTEAAADRCWNCGMVPKRWFDVTPTGLDEQRLLCSNCFARTTRPRTYYGWARSPSADWDDDGKDEKASS